MTGFTDDKLIADVAGRDEAEGTDEGGGGVGEEVAVEVGGEDDVVEGGVEEELVEEGVDDLVVEEDGGGGLGGSGGGWGKGWRGRWGEGRRGKDLAGGGAEETVCEGEDIGFMGDGDFWLGVLLL